MNKLITIAACLTLTALLHAQTIIRVTPNGTGDGTSWENACNLEEAISVVERSRNDLAANPGVSTSLNDRVQIWAQKGTYHPSKMLIIPASVKIYGGFSGTETILSQRNFSANLTIIDGQQKIGSIFRLEKSTEINGFTIQNGNANGNLQKNGGGVWADENTIIENCRIINNAATLNGGGVYANGEVKIINSTIENNIALGSGKNTFGNCLIIKTNENNISPNTIAGCNDGIPDFGEISFKTDKIWKITTNDVNQEWSDVVMASGCNKTWYNGGNSGNYSSDCRANSDRAKYADLFSWCAVARFSYILCPNGWRVPTKEDFYNLDKAMGGNGDGSGPSPNGTPITDVSGKVYYNSSVLKNYVSIWGGAYGGMCDAGGVFDGGQGIYMFFWGQLEHNATNGSCIHLNSTDVKIRPQGYYEKSRGYTLRCVR